MANIAKQGYLMKSPPLEHSGWKRKAWMLRYFVLRREGARTVTLKYYEDKSKVDKKEKGSIQLSPPPKLYIISGHKTYSSLFGVATHGEGRVFYMAAFPRAEMESWLRVLSRYLEVQVENKLVTEVKGLSQETARVKDERLLRQLTINQDESNVRKRYTTLRSHRLTSVGGDNFGSEHDSDASGSDGEGESAASASSATVAKSTNRTSRTYTSEQLQEIMALIQRGGANLDEDVAALLGKLEGEETPGKEEKMLLGQIEELQENLSSFEVAADVVKLSERLGQGCFGEVWKGYNEKTPLRNGKHVEFLAVKMLKNQGSSIYREQLDFLQEATCMAKFDHIHVISLLAIHTSTEPFLLMTELMDLGNLKSYLRWQVAEGTPPTLGTRLWLAFQVAIGMNYLANVKKFVHRDLAARNVLMKSNKDGSILAKVADFGLTRDIYQKDYYRQGKPTPLPVKWMALECLAYGVYTQRTDVWSFGVLLWEIMTNAMNPYPGVDNCELFSKLSESNLKLTQPEQCPSTTYDIILDCTEHKPEDRPTFDELCLILDADLSNENVQYPREAYLKEVQEVQESAGQGPRQAGDEATPSLEHTKEILSINDLNCLSDVGSLTSDTLLRLLDGDSQFTEQLRKDAALANDRQFLMQNVKRLWLSRGASGVDNSGSS